MNQRCVVVQYLLEQHFDNDIGKMAKTSGYLPKAIKEWIDGLVIPNHTTISLLQGLIFTPEFSVVEEFYEIDSSKQILTQLKEMQQKGSERN